MDEKLAKRIRAEARIEAKRRRASTIRRGVAVGATTLTTLFAAQLIAHADQRQSHVQSPTDRLAGNSDQAFVVPGGEPDGNGLGEAGPVPIPAPTTMTTSQS